MHATMAEVLRQAPRRSGYLRGGLGTPNPNVGQQTGTTTCTRCTTNPIWYIGTAIGGVTLAALFLRAIAS